MNDSTTAVRKVMEAVRAAGQASDQGPRIYIPGADGQSGWALESRKVPQAQLEGMLKDSSLPAKTKLEIMQAIDSGEVLDGNPEAYDCAKGHLQFFAENRPLFGQENPHTWIRRITGGGSGTLTNKRDRNAIKTDMTDKEYEAARQVSEGFYDTAAQLNRRSRGRSP
ncbi:hypothetical protein [Eleftheria terrae]|uniref:hypothetical protein n=1 Tax=Eleftheria terrae TaxID=1597781 RepID=UPI00263B60AA|nr:hypothetical protein [Eleftheria terrae]WKB55654.1 hypothetical protein N7L95_26655 [Eleftheria terrae]